MESYDYSKSAFTRDENLLELSPFAHLLSCWTLHKVVFGSALYFENNRSSSLI